MFSSRVWSPLAERGVISDGRGSGPSPSEIPKMIQPPCALAIPLMSFASSAFCFFESRTRAVLYSTRWPSGTWSEIRSWTSDSSHCSGSLRNCRDSIDFRCSCLSCFLQGFVVKGDQGFDDIDERGSGPLPRRRDEISYPHSVACRFISAA